MSDASLLPLAYRRTDFVGRTDRFSSNSNQGMSKWEPVIKGVSPVEVRGSLLSDRYIEDAVSRLGAYSRFWRYYSGKHFTVEYDNGLKQLATNFCKRIVDKRAAWTAGGGFALMPQKGNEWVAEVLDMVWGTPIHKRNLVRRSSKTVLTAGDGFWYFSVISKDQKEDKLPLEHQYVAVTQLNPSYCFPIWREDRPNELAAFMLQFPIGKAALGKNYGGSNQIFTGVWTPTKISFYFNEVLKSEVENVLGVIPIVHIPCNPLGEFSFGCSILDGIIPLNEVFNEIMLSIRRVLRYHGEPTTIIYGARLSNAERGANKVWSNFPPPDKCRVENLVIQGDLPALNTTLDRLEQQIYKEGRTPKFCYDSDNLAVSNTSGIAMQLLFQPLIEATLEIQDQFSLAIMRGNGIISAIHKAFLGEDLTELADDPSTALLLVPVWVSLLPKDDQTAVDLAEKKIALGVWSKAEAIRQLSGVEDTTRLTLELAADQRYELAVAGEKARALARLPVSGLSSFLSSTFLSEDLLDIAKEIADIAGDGSKVSENIADGEGA